MRGKKSQEGKEVVVVEAGYLLKEVFVDHYEYEVYQSVLNGIDLGQYCPEEVEVYLTPTVNRTRFCFPEKNPKLMIVKVPVPKTIKSPKKRAEIRDRSEKKYVGLIPKLKMEVKDELVMRKRLLVHEKEQIDLEKLTKKKRAAGLRKVKREIAKQNK